MASLDGFVERLHGAHIQTALRYSQPRQILVWSGRIGSRTWAMGGGRSIPSPKFNIPTVPPSLEKEAPHKVYGRSVRLLSTNQTWRLVTDSCFSSVFHRAVRVSRSEVDKEACCRSCVNAENGAELMDARSRVSARSAPPEISKKRDPSEPERNNIAKPVAMCATDLFADLIIGREYKKNNGGVTFVRDQFQSVSWCLVGARCRGFRTRSHRYRGSRFLTVQPTGARRWNLGCGGPGEPVLQRRSFPLKGIALRCIFACD